MGALAKDITLHAILEGVVGAAPERTAKVKEISFDPSQFEAGKIDTTTGGNLNGSGFYRTSGYIALPENPWMGQLYADKPWAVNIVYYDREKTCQDHDANVWGYCRLKDYPYCRLFFYQQTDFLSNNDFIADHLKIQYIEDAPAENEYFLYNHLFNGNFLYDRNEDGLGDGWKLVNSPANYSVNDNTQVITPSAANYFLTYESSDSRLAGHVIYVAFTAYTPAADCVINVFGTTLAVTKNTKYTRSSKLFTATVSGANPRFTVGAGGASTPVYIKNVMMIDLTDIYGEGKEPSASVIDYLVDKFYGGYVPCNYICKYDDSAIPATMLSLLQNIKSKATAYDRVTCNDGTVVSVGHYIDDELQSTTTIERDMYGNIVSIEEV